MKKCDLLDDLIHGRITPDEADDICSAVLADKIQTGPAHEILGLTRKEWTAYAHGTGFKDLAYWREHGWPDRCFICGQRIDSDNFGWLAREFDGKVQLKHIVCPEVARKSDTR